ncbi:MAG: hypothetical protein ABI857_13410 [Acidobacteriota bacterium]
MKFLYAIFLAIVVSPSLTVCQTRDDESNWFKLVKDRDDYYSRFDFTRYSADDVLKAARIYKQIEETTSADEWEGLYSTQVAIGEAELRWRASKGFVFHHVYHTLSSLQYGAVLAEASAVRLISPNARQVKSPLFRDRLIKVKFGKKHYLVPQSRLRDFAERAAGREITDFLEEWHFWQRIDEYDLTVEGLPSYPEEYAHLIVSPIKTKILRVGHRRVVPSKSTTDTVNYDDIYVSVALADGYNKGIKAGMDFFVPELGEWIEVRKVTRFRSSGRIRRDFDLEGREQCWDSDKGSGQPFTCKKVVKGLAVVTKPPDGF